MHADPAGEMPAVLLLCDGSVELASADRHPRPCRPADFFVGPLESALGAGRARRGGDLPVPPGRTGSAWVEVSRRAGDYALCGVGADW